MTQTFRPSLCLLDLNMPGMDGDEVALRMHSLPFQPHMLIAVTAMSDEESRARTTAAGFNLHLVKPVDPMELLEVVDALRQAVSMRLVKAPTRKDLPNLRKSKDLSA